MEEFKTQLYERLESYWDTLIASIPKITIAIIILCVFVLIAIYLGNFLRKRLGKKAKNQLALNFIVRLVKTTLIIMGFILAMHTLGFTGLAGGLLAGAGVGTVVLGFAFKEIGENFLAGFLLVFDSPFQIGDTIELNGNLGKVMNLYFRTTHLKTFDGKDVYIPNSSVITNDLYNLTQDGFLRQQFTIGIDYDDDIEMAREKIIELVNSKEDVLKDEQTQVLIDEFGTNTVNLKILFWVKTFDYKVSAAELKTEIMRDVKNLLMKNNFGLPANIQEIKMYRPDPIPVIIQQQEKKN
ncbi:MULTISPECIES: mechanosensitive ion channel family protein [unclassified Maribacter]|uniref:mechanosensitive ion channel family protein n=1 Tax=unclassified Maribacter TaxID=2615042 RepID=UPI00257B251A|nr:MULTISPECIES: mechanosensitive ion channel domain-containing protein [unclassified Maribacter]|tara:strand:- start:241 stop:1128 length:888 start_codon:yes stop_codon:yes gene_type:complete